MTMPLNLELRLAWRREELLREAVMARLASQARASNRSPEGAGAIVRVAALFARAVVVHRGWHGHRHAQRHLGADVGDVMHRATGDPDELVFARLDERATRQLPLDPAGHDYPPLVKILVPVR